MREIKVGVALSTWRAGPQPDFEQFVAEAESAGFDSLWCPESYGADALTPLAWAAARTSRIKLGTCLMQIGARAPAAAAMAAATLDHLSAGRFVLGLGVSGPQVVEGWYGAPFAAPLARTREYVDIIRQALRRDAPVTSPGPHYPLPLNAGAEWGKPLKMILRPLRPDVPIYLGSQSPKNIELTGEIAAGWLPNYFAPRLDSEYRARLEAGLRRAGRSWHGFEVAPTMSVHVTDDANAAVWAERQRLAMAIGAMGPRSKNFHAQSVGRLGYEREVEMIQQLWAEGKRQEAARTVPRALVGDLALIGSAAKLRDDIDRLRDTVVTTVITRPSSLTALRQIAEVFLG